MSDRLLSTRLKELESAGLVRREVQSGPRVRVSYELTEQGRLAEAGDGLAAGLGPALAPGVARAALRTILPRPNAGLRVA